MSDATATLPFARSTQALFGFTISAASTAEIAAVVRDRPRTPDDGVGLIVTPNVDHVVMLRRDPRFAAAYNSAAIVACDGFPVRAYARRRGIACERVTGTDILAAVMMRALPSWQRPFFVADSEATVSGLEAWADRHGGRAALATEVPPMGALDQPAWAVGLAARIRAHRTTLLVMGVGAPRSEIFVHSHRALLPPCWALCVGVAVRVQAGLASRAPGWVQAMNAEWLWRIGQEPRRLAGRYLRDGVLFPLEIGRDLAEARRRSRAS